MSMVRSFGGSPTPISWGELYTSLQQGVVDGAENNPPSFYLSGHYEVARYYVLNEHTAVPDVLVVGTALWDRLTPPAASVAPGGRRRLRRRCRSGSGASRPRRRSRPSRRTVVEVIRPDKRPFADAVAPMLTEVDPRPGPRCSRRSAVGLARLRRAGPPPPAPRCPTMQ